MYLCVRFVEAIALSYLDSLTAVNLKELSEELQVRIDMLAV